MIQPDLATEILNHDIISFDIFDTLLLRPYWNSGDLFLHLENLYRIPGFAKARRRAEKDARLMSSTEEICLDDIYAVIPAQFKKMKESELAFEQAILKPNPTAWEIFNFAKKNKKKIIITSDMYLPKDFLRKTLKINGYDFDDLFVSCAVGKTKESGHLFEYLIQALNKPGDTILHIGDNKHSDYDMAIKGGLAAYHLKSPKELFLQNDERLKPFLDQTEMTLDLSVMLGVISYIYTLPDTDYYECIGYKYGGPAIWGYMNWLKEKLSEQKITDVLFVARDGYTLQKVFNLSDTTKQYHTAYIYASRVFDILFNLNYRERMRLSPDSEGISAIRKIINSYIHADKILEKEAPAKITDCKQGNAFIQKHLSIFEKLAERKKQGYESYLKSLIHTDKVAIVDTASIYLSSQKLVTGFLAPKGIKTYGFYWSNPTENKIKNRGHIFYSFQKSHHWEFINWGVMELFMTAPEPPIEDFQNGKIIYKKPSEQEEKRIHLYPAISNGEILFAQTMHQFFHDIPVPLRAETITNWINHFCSVPTKRDIDMLGDIQTGIDSNHSQYIPLFKRWFEPKREKRSILLFGKLKIGSIQTKNHKTKICILGIPVMIKKSNQ